MTTPKKQTATRTQLSEQIVLGFACTPPFFYARKNGRTVSSRTAIKNHIQGHRSIPDDASKYQSGQSGTLRGRVTAARKQTLAFDSSSRQNHVPPIGGFPGSGQVVDPASQYAIGRTSRSFTADHKNVGLRLFLS
jgi:hypothetical protein